MVEGVLLFCIPLAWVIGYWEGRENAKLKWIEREEVLRKQIKMEAERNAMRHAMETLTKGK